MADGPLGEAVFEVRYWVVLCEVGACRAPTLNGLFPNPTEQGQEIAVEDTVDVRL